MRKLILLILITGTIQLLAQDSKSNPNVELPDFIITGKEVVSVEQAKKIPHLDLISNPVRVPELCR
jgi:hypothetical protein